MRIKQEDLVSNINNNFNSAQDADNYYKDNFKKLTGQEYTPKWKTSKAEDKLYVALANYLGVDDSNKDEIIAEYKDSSRYPYRCDFYVPKLKLFIEVQGDPSHGNHPYNPEVDTKESLSQMNSAFTNAFDRYQEYINNGSQGSKPRAIRLLQTYLVEDPRKRAYVNQNNLYFMEIFPKGINNKPQIYTYNAPDDSYKELEDALLSAYK